MGYHPVLGFGIEGGARWQRLRNLLGGKLRLECVVCNACSVCVQLVTLERLSAGTRLQGLCPWLCCPLASLPIAVT